MQTAKILKFLPVCNNFVKAEVLLGDGNTVFSLVHKVDGVPIFAKGSQVAYVDTAGRWYKGHWVQGELADVDMLQDHESYEIASDWGLT